MLKAEDRAQRPVPTANLKERSKDIIEAEKVKERYDSHEVLDGAEKQIALKDAKETLKDKDKTRSQQIYTQEERQRRSNVVLTPNIMERISAMLEKISIASISVTLPRVGTYLNNLRIFPQRSIADRKAAAEQTQIPNRPAILAVKQIFTNLVAGISDVIGAARSIRQSLSGDIQQQTFPAEKLAQEARWMGVSANPSKKVVSLGG